MYVQIKSYGQGDSVSAAFPLQYNKNWSSINELQIRYSEKLINLHIQYMNINMFVADDANEILVLLLAHFLEFAHRIHTFGTASCTWDCDPKLEQAKYHKWNIFTRISRFQLRVVSCRWNYTFNLGCKNEWKRCSKSCPGHLIYFIYLGKLSVNLEGGVIWKWKRIGKLTHKCHFLWITEENRNSKKQYALSLKHGSSDCGNKNIVMRSL